MTTAKPSTLKEILEVVTTLPGATSGQIIDLMPHVKKQSVYAGLNSLYVRGTITREKTKANCGFAWSVNPDGKPPVAQRTVKWTRSPEAYTETKIVLPPPAIFTELEELRRWKAEAIERYPDLAVSPIVLKARQMVAEEIGNADEVMRKAVLAGQRDGTITMRVAVKMLETYA